jgi:N-acetylmuramoyl-L-alanine amidase
VQNGTTEVHIAWVVALKLQRILEARGLKVVMTKSREDELVHNKERALIASQSGAALMVRLHCDTGRDEGLALYFPDRQAAKDGVTGPSQDVIERSKNLASTLHAAISRDLSGVLKDGGVRGDSQTFIGSQQGVLTASIFSQVPIVTIEMVVLSNKNDAEFIKSEAGQEKMAHAIAGGIDAFIAGSQQ